MVPRAQPSRKMFLLMAFSLLSFGLVCGGVMAWLLVVELRDYAYAMENTPPLISWSSGVGILFVSPLIALVFILLAVLALRRALSNEIEPSRAPSMFEKVIAIFTLFTAALLIVAGVGGRFYSEHALQRAGYERCPNSFFLTSQWFISVWTRDLDYCRDPQVRSLMASPRHGIDDINEYLRER